jgi:dGTPase
MSIHQVTTKAMNWNQLLSSQRFGEETPNYDSFVHRSAFQRDFDRIIFSSAFRRLQDKTQVFPVPQFDFVHNRLTHSLEVAMVGRSLGNLAGEFILTQKHEIPNAHMSMFGDIVAAAALGHDLGNPPFGHSGEKAISDFFVQNNYIKTQLGLSDFEWADFIKYEGNAHGFRIMTNHHPDEVQGGLRLSAATLATFAKYPHQSILPSHSAALPKRVSFKKYSVFNSEWDAFNEIASKTGLLNLSDDAAQSVYCRHPLVFLVEAADNICYRIIDLEDGYKQGFLRLSEIEELLFPLLQQNAGFKTTEAKYSRMRDEGEKVSYLRAKSINQLVDEAFDAFKFSYEDMMTAQFDAELTDNLVSTPILEGPIKKSNLFLYQRKPVLEKELAGYQVIYGLLERFVSVVTRPQEMNAQKLKLLLPLQFIPQNNESKYLQLMRMVDFVARMTDGYALNLYRTLTGQNLPR